MGFPTSLLLSAVLASTSIATAQERVEDSTYGFSFPAPDAPWSRTQGLSPADLYTYTYATADGSRCFLDFRRLDDVLTTDGSDMQHIVDHRDEYIQKMNLPENTEISLLTGKVKDRTLYGTRMIMHNDVRTVFTEMLNLPLLPNAIQVIFSGPISERTELEDILQKTVCNMDGRAYGMNVTTDPVPAWQHFAVGLFEFVAVLGFIFLICKLRFGSGKPKPSSSDHSTN